MGSDRRHGLRGPAGAHRAVAPPLRGSAWVDRASGVRGRDRGLQPAAGTCVDAARDPLRLARARPARRARGRARVHPARAPDHSRAFGALPGELAAALRARGRSRSRGGCRGRGGSGRLEPRARQPQALSQPGAVGAVPDRRRRGGGARSARGSCSCCWAPGSSSSRFAGSGTSSPPSARSRSPPSRPAAIPALVWVAFKVGALSFGGGFVIIPLMQADAVNHYHWMSSAQFLNAVALGQVTPGPVVLTVSVVGYAAAGVAGALLAALVAFSPSFVFVLGGAGRFQWLRSNDGAKAFLGGAGPAAAGRSSEPRSRSRGRCRRTGNTPCSPAPPCCCSRSAAASSSRCSSRPRSASRSRWPAARSPSVLARRPRGCRSRRAAACRRSLRRRRTRRAGT